MVTEEDIQKYENKVRAEVIDDVLIILKSQHMFRTCEDDYNASIEAPFYRKLYARILELKEQK